jgi:hypothetical protein
VYRKAAATPRATRELVFDRLPPAVRDRLARALANGAPEALLAAPSGAGSLALRASMAAAVAAGVALIGVALRGLGDLDGRGLSPVSFAGLYAALLATAALGGVAFAAIRRFQRGMPFRPGRYLFALDLVEAQGGRLSLTSLDTVKEIEVQGGRVGAVFEDGYAVSFPVATKDDPATLVAEVKRAVASARALALPADQGKLERLDPFFELRDSEDWAAAADTGARPRSRLALVAAAAVLAAGPAGYGLLLARNALSDDLMFADAQAYFLVGGSRRSRLTAYLSHGHRHVEEAARLLVDDAGDDLAQLRRYLRAGGPLAAAADEAIFQAAKDDPAALSSYLGLGGRRADDADEALFAIARRMDTLPAYNTYLDHGRLHAAEVKDHLRPEADFRQASRSGQIGSLFSFVRRNPGSSHEEEAWKRIRAAYADALPRFRAVEQPPPRGLRFAEALLAAAQDRADPRAALDVDIQPPTLVAAADAVLGSAHGDRYLPAARRFGDRALFSLDREIRIAVNNWFGRAFPSGVVEITRPSGEDEGGPRFRIALKPVVDGQVQWRKVGVTGGEPDLVTPLVGFDVEVTGTIPGREGEGGTIGWTIHLGDTTPGKMRTHTFTGTPRAQQDLIEDAFALFLRDVPERIAASFHEAL